MKIYVAAPWVEMERARFWMRHLRDAQHEITVDWTVNEGEQPDWKLSRDERAKFAVGDLEGISSADLVWLLFPTKRGTGKGCFIEFGYALAQEGCEIVVSGADHHGTIFTALAGKCFDTDQDAFRHITGQPVPVPRINSVNSRLHSSTGQLALTLF